MVDLTVVIMTKNEENNLRKCVESFRGAAKRFVVVDSCSTDATKDVAGKLDRELRAVGSRLDFYENPWTNHAEQFNWALSHTSIETAWTMRMDADEELLVGLAQEIERELPGIAKQVTGIILRRRIIFMGRWIRHGGRYPEKLLRIFRTGQGMCEQKMMDEHIIVKGGKVIEFTNDFADHNTKDLEWWTGKHNWYSSKEVLDRQMTVQKELKQEENAVASGQARRKRLIKNYGYYSLPKFFRSHLYFFYRYYLRLGFLDGTEGKIFHFLQAYWYRFLVDAKLYECEKFNRKMKEQGDLKA